MGLAGVVLLAAVVFFFKGLYSLSKFVLFKISGILVTATVTEVESSIKNNKVNINATITVQVSGNEVSQIIQTKGKLNKREIFTGKEIQVLWREASNSFIEPNLWKIGLLELFAGIVAAGLFLLIAIFVVNLQNTHLS